MEDKITLHKRTLRVLIIASLLATGCLIALNPAKAISEEVNQINYFAIIGFSFYLLSLALLFFLNSWGKILFTIYVLEGLIARWYGPEYIEPAESLFLLFTYLEGMIEGAILAVIFLTPITKLFKSVKGHL